MTLQCAATLCDCASLRTCTPSTWSEVRRENFSGMHPRLWWRMVGQLALWCLGRSTTTAVDTVQESRGTQRYWEEELCLRSRSRVTRTVAFDASELRPDAPICDRLAIKLLVVAGGSYGARDTSLYWPGALDETRVSALTENVDAYQNRNGSWRRNASDGHGTAHRAGRKVEP